MADLEAEIDQVLADNRAIAKAADMAADAWPWSDRTDGRPADHGWDWSPDILGGTEWRRPTSAELAIHMVRIAESLRGPADLGSITSGHIKMWVDDETDELRISLELA